MFTLDASDGTERWSVELEFGGVPGHMLTVYGGMVLFYDGTNDIRAVDADDGSAVWVGNVRGSNNGASIVDDVDYTTSGNSRSRSIQPTGPSSGSGPYRRSSTGLSWTRDCSRAGDGELIAYDLQTGEKVWAYPRADGMNFPTTHDGTVYVNQSTTGMIALEVDSGEEKWVFERDLRLFGASPTVVGGTVFSTATNEMRAIEADT